MESKRPGAVTITLDVWHRDLSDFLKTPLNNTVLEKQMHKIFLAVSIPDLFFRKLANGNETFYQFDPKEVLDVMGYGLEDFYDEREDGGSFTEKYEECVEAYKKGQLQLVTETDPLTILGEINKTRIEKGHPFLFFRDTVNRDNPNKGMIYCSNLCVTGDTQLLTDKGYRRAKDLYDSKEDIKVIIDNRTKEMDMNSKGTSVVKAVPMQLTAKQAKVYEVKTKAGYSLKATEWHKMYIYRDGELLKVPLKDVQEGDKLLVQSGEGVYGDFSDPELAYIAGLVVGVGVINDKVGKFYPHGYKKAHKDTVESLLAKVVARYKDKVKVRSDSNKNPILTEQVYKDRLGIQSAYLNEILLYFGVTKEDVPDFVKSGTKETQGAYLSGLYQVSGMVNASEKCKEASYELVSIKEGLLKSVQMLLLNAGVYSNIYRSEHSNKLLQDARGSYKDYDTKPTYKLAVQDRVSRERFSEFVTLKDKDEARIEEFNNHLQPKSNEPEHKFISEVEYVRFHGIEDVYDTNQPDYHSLIFNGVVTGNCTEIALPMSLPTVKSETIDVNGKKVIAQYTEPGDIPTCNLSSFNLAKLAKIRTAGKDWRAYIAKIIPVQYRLLSNVIFLNDHGEMIQTKISSLNKREVGQGVFGLAHALAISHIAIDSEAALEWQNEVFEELAFWMVHSSMEKAKETGDIAPAFKVSKWADGSYIDNKYKKYSTHYKDRWERLKKDVMKYGMFSTALSCTAPTETISYIANTSAGTDPVFNKEYTLEKSGIKTNMVAPDIGADNFFYYKDAFRINKEMFLKGVGIRQRWIDQSISTNLYYIKDDLDAIEVVQDYINAWKNGVKTLYYHRSQSATAYETICAACSG